MKWGIQMQKKEQESKMEWDQDAGISEEGRRANEQRVQQERRARVTQAEMGPGLLSQPRKLTSLGTPTSMTPLLKGFATCGCNNMVTICPEATGEQTPRIEGFIQM